MTKKCKATGREHFGGHLVIVQRKKKNKFELGLEFDESYSYTNNSSYDEY